MKHNLSPTSRHSKGFTLLEILLAVAIAAIVITIVTSTFYQSHRAIESVKYQREVYQMVRIVMDRIIKDISCAYIPADAREMTDDEISLYRFVGRNEINNEANIDSIFFTTTCDMGLSPLTGSLCEVGYYLKEMEEKQDLFFLMRREDCTPHYGITEAGNAMEIAEDVVALEIIYYDDRSQESEEWDLDESLTLPSKVKVTLTFRQREKDISFSGVSSLPLKGIKLTRAQENQ